MPTLRLEFIKGTMTGKVMEITSQGVMFGRDPSCEIRLDEALISRQHARIKLVEGRYLFEDLGSTNGVRVNGVRLRGSTPLAEGDHVTVGETEFIARCPVTVPVGEKTAEAKVLTADKTHIPEIAANKTVTELPTAEDVAPKWIMPTMIAALILAVAAWLVAPSLINRDTTVPEVTDPALVELPTDPTSADPTNSRPAIPDSPTDETPNATTADSPRVDLPPWGHTPIPPTATNPQDPAQTAEPPTAPPIAPPPPAKRDARYIWVDSQPSGAEVMVNGVARGRTPLFLDQLAEGRYAIRLSHDGYAPAERYLEVPNTGERFSYTLPQDRRTCQVTSDPPGAAIMHGSQILGYTPAIIRNPFGTTLLPVRLTLPYHSPADLSLRFEASAGTTANATLAPQLGRLELKTVPAGATIYLDDFDKGEATPAAAGSALSTTMIYDGLNAGPHEVYVMKLGVKSDVTTVTIAPGETTSAQIMLWLPDTEFILNDTSVVVGLVLKETPTEIQVLVDPKKMRLLNAVEVKRRRLLDARESQLKYREMQDELRRQEMQRKLEELRKNDNL